MDETHFMLLALGCGAAAVIASYLHTDARFMSLMWALLAIAASVLAAGVAR